MIDHAAPYRLGGRVAVIPVGRGATGGGTRAGPRGIHTPGCRVAVWDAARPLERLPAEAPPGLTRALGAGALHLV